MFFTIKKPQSKRFVRFNLKAFGDRAAYGFRGFLLFVQTFIRYFFLRVNLLIALLTKLLQLFLSLPAYLKRELVRKLIWSRGKLGRAIATGFILVASFLVFVAGEYLSGFSFVVTSEANSDYLTTSVDLIAKKEITTTEIPDIRKRVEPFEYTIEVGDTLYDVGNKFKVSIDAIKYVNNLTDNSVLTVGKTITIPPVSGLIHTVKSGETLSSIAGKYQVASQAIADFNYLLNDKLAVGTELVIPGATVPEPIAPPVYLAPSVIGPSNLGQATASKNFCVWPTTVRIITQHYAWYHNGLDIATPWSGGMPPIFACTGGTVVRAGWDPWGLGLHVRIDHGNGYVTIYGHMSRLDVSYGQSVDRGQALGLMGSTGRSSGPHVHFMVDFNGVPQNPLNYLN